MRPSSSIRTETPGSGLPTVVAWSRASSVGRATTPELVSVIPYEGTTGQPASSARRIKVGGIGPPPRMTARIPSGGGRSSVSSRSAASCEATSERWLTTTPWPRAPSMASRRAAVERSATVTTGTPARAARATMPTPATCASPSVSSQPVAGGRNLFQAVALAAIRSRGRRTRRGRAVVPEVGTINSPRSAIAPRAPVATASGSRSRMSSPSGGRSPAPGSTTSPFTSASSSDRATSTAASRGWTRRADAPALDTAWRAATPSAVCPRARPIRDPASYRAAIAPATASTRASRSAQVHRTPPSTTAGAVSWAVA